MVWLQALLIFLFSASSDWLSVRWQRAREQNLPLRGAVLSIILSTIGWLSVIWIVADSYLLMVPDLIGAAVGSYFGIKQAHQPLSVTPAGIIIRAFKSLGDNHIPKEKE